MDVTTTIPVSAAASAVDEDATGLVGVPADAPRTVIPFPSMTSNNILPDLFFAGGQWRCPFRACPKVYKQSAGLVYHLQGSHLPDHLKPPKVVK